MSESAEEFYVNTIHETFSYGIIYIYSIQQESHAGRLKIGSATVTHPNPTQKHVEAAARQRIEQQTRTADIGYTLEHAELAVTVENEYFPDHKVHEVLRRSGYKRKSENVHNNKSEWFEIDLAVAKNAIQAVKEGRQSLTANESSVTEKGEFPFRPNQRAAIDQTLKALKGSSKHFLWNAKMRFGKTSAAMQVAKEAGLKKVLIVTHRPSVGADWYDDFKEIFHDTNYEYSSADKGEKISDLIDGTKPFVYFASLQNLRLSKRVVESEGSGTDVSGFDKNDEVFDTQWDMLIVDEAHEGTQSNLGDATFANIHTDFTLQLSGTPFNILHKHEEKDVYTWDYVMEQEAKQNWDTDHPGLPNPYAELPSLSMFTYDIDNFSGYLGGLGEQFKDTIDGAFRFHEFFKVHTDDEGKPTAKFVNEKMVKKFLDLLVDDTLDTKFPYATEVYRNYNKHSLWLLPNRTETIRAMELLLKSHPVFGSGAFGIVNISGNRHDDEQDTDAKNAVENAIKDNEYTVTLTGQRLTTGASIKQWTAVFMMSDTSSATTYLQTAFRCQTPAKIDGKLKTQGYVFDFAPDRTLRLVAEAIELNHKPGKGNTTAQKEAMAQFLNFCPILAASGGKMKPYDVSGMLRQLKRAIAERVYRTGFEDPKLYNDELLNMDDLDIKRFNDLRAIVGNATTNTTNEVQVNDQGFDGNLQKLAEEAEQKEKKKEPLTPEQQEALKQLQEARKQKKSAVSILRAVSIRMPMLVYGASVSVREDITLDAFINLVDEESWAEFMPPGLSKDQFREFTKFYDEDVFRAVAHSIRARAYDCDALLPAERIRAIAEIFSTFKNPDKETVLTPWKVVNLHLTTAFGGHDFISDEINKKTGQPKWVSKGVDTSVWDQPDTKILEINAKSGMYPLLAAYNVYTRKLKAAKVTNEAAVATKLWNEVLAENIFVLCKSPMAQSITKRTLAGYNEGTTTNIVHIEHLVDKLKGSDAYPDYELRTELLAAFNQSSDMKFTAVVGNPPYQETQDGYNRQEPIYHHFYQLAEQIAQQYCLISPARFLFDAGLTPKPWNDNMLTSEHVQVLSYTQNSNKLFPNTEIKGGVAIVKFDHNATFEPIRKFIPQVELKNITSKVTSVSSKNLPDIMYGGRSDLKYNQKFIEKYPKSAEDRLKQIQNKHPKVKSLGHNEELELKSSTFETLDYTFKEKEPLNRNNFYKILGLVNGNRAWRWVERDLMTPRYELRNNINKWKVFVSKANGTGTFGEIISPPVLAGPYTSATPTFISLGHFDSKVEAANLLKFIKTKFVRGLLGVLKVTQDNPPSKWTYVPLEDFTSKSDIDWSQSVANIDQQLYRKYKLDQTEIDFIETNVKPMT